MRKSTCLLAWPRNDDLCDGNVGLQSHVACGVILAGRRDPSANSVVDVLSASDVRNVDSSSCSTV